MSRIESVVKFNMNNHIAMLQKTGVQNNNACDVQTRPATTDYTASNLQAYYCTQPSFGYAAVEHIRNNGAYVDASKRVFFSLFSDAEKVFLVLKKAVSGDEFRYPMELDYRNIFRTELQPSQAQSGDKYAFEVMRNGKNTLVPDPQAHRKVDFKSVFSEIYDHHIFEWTDQDWMAGNNPARISRIDNNGLTPLKQARILEINIPTFSKEGTFNGAIEEIEKLVKKGVFKQDGTGKYNAVEIMPVESTYAPSWGYDGVFKGAPMEAYGGPDGVKRFNNYLHSNGINSIIDAVPNHFGDDGNSLGLVGPYFSKIKKQRQYEFGPVPNFENDPQNNSQVRSFMSNVCSLNWLTEYHFDGVRLDYTNNMDSDTALRQLIEEANFHSPHSFFIIEDDRVNQAGRLCRPIPIQATEENHVCSIEQYSQNINSLGEIGANGRWGYEVEHAMKALLKGETSITEFYNTFLAAIARGDVLYGIRQSHDEIGNEDAIRAVVDLTKNKLNMFKDNRVVGINDKEKGFRAAQATQALLTKFVSGQLDSNAFSEIAERYHVVNMPTVEEIGNALKSSIAKNKVSQSIISTTPNVAKMQFMGGLADITPFRFFRTLSENAEADYRMLEAEKGYRAGQEALEESKLNAIPYTDDYSAIRNSVDQYELDLNEIVQSSEALKTGKIVSSVTNHRRVLVLDIKGETDEFITVSNFADKYNDGNYGIKFPQGKWQMVICSEDTKYAGSGKNIQIQDIISDGKNESKISLPANSFTLFKKIN